MSASPWGAVQTRRELAPGIVEVSTASHGGFLLSAERAAAVVAKFPGFTPWAGAGAYEEDCDWALVALTFPQFFEPRQVAAAQSTVAGQPDYFKVSVSAPAAVETGCRVLVLPVGAGVQP